MTSNLLLVHASAGGDNSATRKLANCFVDHWRQRFEDSEMITRDVVANPIPHVGKAYLANMNSKPHDEAGGERIASYELTEVLQNEVLAATHIVIATPMHIFSVPSSLKAWTDHIFHNGVVFEGSATGIIGLLGGKKVLLITSRGGDYRAPSPLAEFDMLVPYFEKLFAFCGVSDFASIDAHNAMFDPADHEAQLGTLPDKLKDFAKSWN